MRPLVPLLLAVAATVAAGCGSAAVEELPPGAAPARAPAPAGEPAGRVVDALAVPEAAAALRSRAVEASGRVFAVAAHADTVTVSEDGRRVGSLDAGPQPGGLAVAQDGTRVAVVSRRARTVTLFDAVTLRAVDRVPVGVGPTTIASDGGGLLYVTDTAGDGVAVLRTSPDLAVTRRVALPGGAPHGIASGVEGGRLFVALSASSELAILSGGEKPGLRRKIPSVRGARAVTVDGAGRIFVAGADPGAVQVLDP